MALAGSLNLNICIISLQSKGINDDTLNHLLNIAPQRSILLLEDIDVAMQRGMSGVTLSGLLNALDGVAATEGGGRLVFMTTNHIDKLPPVLIRPGRVDVRECLDLATPEMVRFMFEKFYPGEGKGPWGDKFVDSLEGTKPSMAQLQGYMMQYKEDPKLAVESVEILRQTIRGQTSTGQGTVAG